MIVRRQHHTTPEEAVRKLDAAAEKALTMSPPAGVKIVAAEKEWQGQNLLFAVKGKKGFMSATVSGVVQVTPEEVVVDFTLPGMLAAFLPEPRVREEIERGIDKLFPAAAPPQPENA